MNKAAQIQQSDFGNAPISSAPETHARGDLLLFDAEDDFESLIADVDELISLFQTDRQP